MSYTVLARRYRSTTFEDIVGQEPIAKTLRNAIDASRTAHAYLFTGTRGVGKTSMARIFARELNRSEDLIESGAIKDAILRGDDLDVIEIDGASNRGVQEARDLIASAGLAPTRCTFRIYIIDEVHMLTTPAFNALLKTMEEPPSHVKFILCTTEPHKVPATIQSRCQRFDFRAISSAKIASHLTYVLDQEGVTADPEVITEVARLGNGSMRDALSILDRLLAGGSKTIKFSEMEELLGLPSQQAVSDLCSAIANCDIEEAFTSADNLICSGISLDRALEVVSIALRHALIARVCGKNSSLLELSDEGKNESEQIGSTLDEPTLTHMIALCDATSRQVRRAGSGRALFDATIARLCMSGQLAEAGGVLKTGVDERTPKKKSVISRPSAVQQSNTVETVKQSEEGIIEQKVKNAPLQWDAIFSTLSSTPGLKRIANYLRFDSLEGNDLKVSIHDSGRESANYILAQKQKIEEVIFSAHSKRISLTFETNNQNEQSKNEASLNVVEGHELVQAARGLFEGTVVQVRNVDKGKQ